MKGFSLKKWIESYRAKYYEPSRDNDNFQELMDYYSIAYAYDNLDKLSEKEISDLKKKFIEVQKSEAYKNDFIGEEDNYLEVRSEEDIVKTASTEGNIRQLIGMIAAGAKLPKNSSNAELLKKAEVANKMVNTFVHDGYNIYPVSYTHLTLPTNLFV